MRKQGTISEKANLPRYLPKDGYFPLIIPIRKRHEPNFPFDKKLQGMQCQGQGEFIPGVYWVQNREIPNKSKQDC